MQTDQRHTKTQQADRDEEEKEEGGGRKEEEQAATPNNSSSSGKFRAFERGCECEEGVRWLAVSE